MLYTCVLKFSDHPNIMISRALCKMLWAFSIFQPDSWPVLSGMFSFNRSSSSADITLSLSTPSAVRPNRRCCMFHFNAAKWTSINLSLGSSISGTLYKGEPGPALRISSLTNLTCIYHLTCYIPCYIPSQCDLRYLWGNKVPQQERESQKKNSDTLTRQMFPLVLLNIHIIKVGSIIHSDLQHGRWGVRRWQAVSHSGPHSDQHIIRHQVLHNSCIWSADNKVRPAQNLLILVQCRWDDIVAINTNKKLMKLLSGHSLEPIEILCSVISIGHQ